MKTLVEGKEKLKIIKENYDENIAENTPDNSEFKPVENIIVINSDIETISKIGSFI